MPQTTNSDTKNAPVNVLPPNPAIEALLAAGTHMGYSRSRQNPKMGEYVFAVRNAVEIFDLSLTEKKLAEAEEFLRSLGKEGKLVLWVGAKPSARMHIEAAAEMLGAPYVSDRWLGGTLTNMKIFEQRLAHWDRLLKEKESGGFEKYALTLYPDCISSIMSISER